MSLAQRIYDKAPVFVQNLLCDLEGRRIARYRYGPEFFEALAWLNESQWWSLAKQRDYQNRKLREQIIHAYEHVPFYRRIMDHRGLKPRDIQTAEDLRKLPIITKEDILAAGSEAHSAAYARSGNVVRMPTSGSTGSSLTVYSLQQTKRFQWATWWRHRQRFGLDVDDMHAVFSAQKIVPLHQGRSPFWRRCRPLNQIRMSLIHMSDAHMPDFIRRLEQGGMRYYSGYPSAVYLLADYLRSVGHKLENGPQYFVSGAESLMDFQKATIHEWIGCPVTDQYGMGEVVTNISQCEEGRYHVDMEIGILETDHVVAESEEGPVCRVVATSLQNPVMPFIRYDVGDLVTFSSERCPCGRESPVVVRIDGRVESYILTPGGQRIGRLMTIFKKAVDVKEAQIVQHQIDALTLRIVRRDSYGPSVEQRILDELRKRVGDRMQVSIEYMDSIPRPTGGKLRAVISTIEQDWISGTDKVHAIQKVVGGAGATETATGQAKVN